MKGTTGQKQRTKQTKNKTPALAWRAMASFTFISLSPPSLDSFQPKRCTKIWHDKRRENETIPIWNLIFALLQRILSQWSRFSGTPSVRRKSISYHSNVSENTTYLFGSERCQVSLCHFELFLGIINRWKKPRICITLDFLYRTWQ